MEKSKKNKTIIIGIVYTVVLFAVVSLVFPSIYVLDDDAMIQSILSGTYFSPYPYTYYFSAELGIILSLFYRIIPSVPWLGLFFVLIYAVSFFLILIKVMRSVDSTGKKWFYAACVTLVFLGLFFSNFIMLHYTVVSATLVFCGLFMMITSKEKRDMIVAMVMFLISYLIRENVFFMSIPFIAVAFLYLLITGKKDFVKKYGKCICIFSLIFIILFVINRCVPADEKWEEYKDYNELRTSVYDYTGIDTNGMKAIDYYESHGLAGEIVLIYKSYNVIFPMILDNNQSADYMSTSKTILEGLDGYSEYKNQGYTTFHKIRDAIYTYVFYMLRYETMRFYHYFLIAVYVAFTIAVLACKKPAHLIALPVAFGVRSFLWIALAYMGRYPDRVLVSSLLMEAAFILALMIRIIEKNIIKPVFSGIILAGFLIAAVFSVKSSVTSYSEESNRIFADNRAFEYIKENKDNFYLLDVYSVVNHSVYAIKDYDPSYENYMMLGGWITGHPLMIEKMESIPEEPYVIVKNDFSDNVFLLENGTGVSLIPVDEIDDMYTVYKIKE